MKLLTYGVIAGAVWYYFLRDKTKRTQLKTPRTQTSPRDIGMDYGAERYLWTWEPSDPTLPSPKTQKYVCFDTSTKQYVDPSICKKYHPGVFR